MNDRQKRFCEEYAACGNGAEAARRAGYAERGARQHADRLLTNVDIQKYIHELRDQAAQLRIASIHEVKAFWSDTMNDTEERTKERLKASELLARADGVFLKPEEQATRTAGDNEQVVFYIPEFQPLEDCEYHGEDE